MSVLEALRIAMQGIAANRMRSVLTLLGITIGVASVIVLVAVGHGSAVAVQTRIEGLGTNLLTVQSGGRGFGRQAATAASNTQLTLKDITALRDKSAAPDVKSVTPVVQPQSISLTRGAASDTTATIAGTTSTYADARKLTVSEGRFLTAADETGHARVVVIGTTVRDNLFGNQDPIGQTMQIGGTTYTVIGLLESKGTNGFQDQDDIAIVPLSSAQDTLVGHSGTLNQILLVGASSGAVDAAEAEATSILTPNHSNSDGSAAFSILNQASLLQTTSASNRTFTVLLAAVAAISLFVGGIGVMNIMLVTVTERTREIGIRKAIGARRFDILAQFLIEAVLLSIIGGVTGVAAGLIGSHFKIVGVQPIVQLYSTVLAFGVGVGVGLFFGLYPANRAAALRPIDALRYE